MHRIGSEQAVVNEKTPKTAISQKTALLIASISVLLALSVVFGFVACARYTWR